MLTSRQERCREEPQWYVGHGQFDGQKLFFRVAITRPHDWRELPHRLGIALPLDAEFPDSRDADRLGLIEEDLIELLRGCPATLVLVLTLPFVREFVFYTREPTTCSELLAEFRSRRPDVIIQSYAKPDPEWGAYEEFASDAKRASGSAPAADG